MNTVFVTLGNLPTDKLERLNKMASFRAIKERKALYGISSRSFLSMIRKYQFGLEEIDDQFNSIIPNVIWFRNLGNESLKVQQDGQ